MSTDKLSAQIRDHVSSELQHSIETAVGDSPIEKLFFRALWLMTRLGVSEHSRIAVPCERFPIQWLLERETPSSLIVVPQVEAAGWRVDFLVYAWDYGRATGAAQWRRLIVECDGHDFHERTKEQAARDRSRDRNAQLRGYSILRFTGSEIHGDPLGCALQVSRWAIQGW